MTTFEEWWEHEKALDPIPSEEGHRTFIPYSSLTDEERAEWARYLRRRVTEVLESEIHEKCQDDQGGS
jgi:hypothetical protein